MPRPFGASPNALFETSIGAVRRLSPGFVRLTFTGPQLAHFASNGLDQRIKVLVPSDGYPAVFDPAADPVPEARWRASWRALPAEQRPVLRSYTVSSARPERGEVDLDFFVHARPGPASSWASSARVGNRVLLSGPDVRRGHPAHGVQWRPGPAATSVLLAGDETAIPAMRGILASLEPATRGHVVVEVADPADLTDLASQQPGVALSPCVRGRAAGGSVLHAAVERWSRAHGTRAARQGEGFYAWIATESTWVAQARDVLARAGIPPSRLHTQGYWHDRSRPSPAGG